MKHHLLTSVAVVAALAFAVPVWAQQANPSGGNSLGTPESEPRRTGTDTVQHGSAHDRGSALGAACCNGSLGDAAVIYL